MKFNKKVLIWSIIITFLIAYIIPGRTLDGFAFDYGYPFGFFTMYNSEITTGDSILSSTLFNPAGCALNVLILYFIFNRFYKFMKRDNGL